ncbi:hypothetical protein FWK35_00010032 [Aphis craccivora]|uniref:Uncharacterized protein n=1 Tax=Aphis craccivora TaxID=307492 RepID=A0A6G0Z740_APHCR|nr:hypothetical protein FWK35_00010032 [Aphis craccivora]
MRGRLRGLHNAAAYKYQIPVRSTKSVSILSYLTVARPTQADLRSLDIFACIILL